MSDNIVGYEGDIEESCRICGKNEKLDGDMVCIYCRRELWKKAIQTLKEIEDKLYWISCQRIDIPHHYERNPTNEGPIMWKYKEEIVNGSGKLYFAAQCLREKLEVHTK